MELSISLPETHTFVLENNYLYNNVAEDYKNANPTTGTQADPHFANEKNHESPEINRWKMEWKNVGRGSCKFPLN